MSSIQVIVRVYAKKADPKIKFSKATVGAKYLPEKLHAEPTQYYNVKLVGAEFPLKEGFVEVTFDEKDIWRDVREEYLEKNIVRIRATSVSWVKELPVRQPDPKPTKPVESADEQADECPELPF